jgi:hypothetical protein
MAAKLLEQITRLDRQLALVARQSTRDAADNVMKVYFNRIAHGIDPTRFPTQAQLFVVHFFKRLKESGLYRDSTS